MGTRGTGDSGGRLHALPREDVPRGREVAGGDEGDILVLTDAMPSTSRERDGSAFRSADVRRAFRTLAFLVHLASQLGLVWVARLPRGVDTPGVLAYALVAAGVTALFASSLVLFLVLARPGLQALRLGPAAVASMGWIGQFAAVFYLPRASWWVAGLGAAVSVAAWSFACWPALAPRGWASSKR